MFDATGQVRQSPAIALAGPRAIQRLPATVFRIFWVAVIAFSIASFAAAATDTWVGNTSSWSTGGWTGGNNPPIANDLLVFGAAGSGGTTLTNDLTAALQFNGITFNSGASAYVIGGNSIKLGGGITNSGTSLETLNFNMATTAVRTITMTSGGGDIALGDVISGTSGGITMAGSGELTLSDTNTYTGGTTVAANTTLNFNNAKAIGTGTLTITGGTLDNTSAAAITNSNNNAQHWNGDFAFTGTQNLNLGTGAVTLNASRQVTVNAGSLTVGGVISGSTFGLTTAGAGTLVLGGVNTFTGATTVNNGTLELASTGSINSTSAVNINSGTLDLEGNNKIKDTAAITIGTSTSAGTLLSLSSSSDTVGAVTLVNGSITQLSTLTGSSYNVQEGSINTILAGTGGLTKNATTVPFNVATDTVTMPFANIYTGVTTINEGILSVGTLANGGTASGIGKSSNAAANLVINGGTLEYTGIGVSTDRLFTLGTSGGALAANGSGAIDFTNTGAVVLSGTNTARTLTLNGADMDANTLAAAIGNNGSGATSLVKNGVGTWILTGSNTYTGGTTIYLGTLQGTTTSLQGNITDNTFLVFSQSANGTFAGKVSGSGRVTITGGGTVTFSGTNTYSSFTTISGATLSISSTGSINGTSLIQIANGTLNTSANEVLNDAATVNVGEPGELVGALNLNGDGNSHSETVAAVTLADGSIGGGTLTASSFDVQDGTISANLAGVGATLTKNFTTENNGTNVVTLSGANTYTGNTKVTGGTLKLGNSLALQDSTLDYNNYGGVISFGTLTYATFGGLQGSESLSLQNSSSQAVALTVGNNNASTVYSGVLSGTGSLIKTGSGSLTLSGTNNYSGSTMVNGGTLAVDGIVEGGASVMVNSGGTLGGSGSIFEPVTVASGGAISPGDGGPGVFTVGALTMQSGSQLNIELGGLTRGSKYDALVSNSSASLTGTLNVSLINSFKPAPGNFDIMDWQGVSVFGTFSTVKLPTLGGRIVWDTSQLYTTGTLSVVATYYAGDFNRDGHVDAGDIIPMMEALTNLNGYKATYDPSLTGSQLTLIGDINGDGNFTNADLQALLDLLKSGGGSSNQVPEPTSATLAAIAALCCCLLCLELRGSVVGGSNRYRRIIGPQSFVPKLACSGGRVLCRLVPSRSKKHRQT
jgi:fibronectin-binding autotransporter adhesin